MKRRKVMKIAAGVFAGTGIGIFTLSNAFKSNKPIKEAPRNLEYDPPESSWKYHSLDPDETAELAYKFYSGGGCMYATVKSVIAQLAEKVGAPYTSFPFQMFGYGHGGIGGYGTVCGALNGAAALIGLLVSEKSIKDSMIADIFQWYEKTPIPEFKPKDPNFAGSLPSSVSNSVLCHASNTNWCNQSGFPIGSNERKERCRRLTSDVAKKVTVSLNEIFAHTYITNPHGEEANTCLACHGKQGKIQNTSTSMSCNPCHSESIGHQVFSDIHYKFMKQ